MRINSYSQFNKMADGMGPQPKPIRPKAPSPAPTPFKKLPDIPKKTYNKSGGTAGPGYTPSIGGGVPGGGMSFAPGMT